MRCSLTGDEDLGGSDSSGSGRDLAHAGVVQAFARHGIHVDVDDE
jgi:hypothetical protein